MSAPEVFVNVGAPGAAETAGRWREFLTAHGFDFTRLESIDFAAGVPVIRDRAGRRFSVDFAGDRRNYAKKKSSFKSELISRALGAGRFGDEVLDLSAGLGMDAVFLAQLGYRVTALERHPLIFLALDEAARRMPELPLRFVFGEARAYLAAAAAVPAAVYFDPMFPEKKKSALPRQEMLFFRELVGADDDAGDVVQAVLSRPEVKRLAVKRPLRAPVIGGRRPPGQLEGKLIRFDLYGHEAGPRNGGPA